MREKRFHLCAMVLLGSGAGLLARTLDVYVPPSTEELVRHRPVCRLHHVGTCSYQSPERHKKFGVVQLKVASVALLKI